MQFQLSAYRRVSYLALRTASRLAILCFVRYELLKWLAKIRSYRSWHLFCPSWISCSTLHGGEDRKSLSDLAAPHPDWNVSDPVSWKSSHAYLTALTAYHRGQPCFLQSRMKDFHSVAVKLGREFNWTKMLGKGINIIDNSQFDEILFQVLTTLGFLPIGPTKATTASMRPAS
jgi:hypothetical protein